MADAAKSIAAASVLICATRAALSSSDRFDRSSSSDGSATGAVVVTRVAGVQVHRAVDAGVGARGLAAAVDRLAGHRHDHGVPAVGGDVVQRGLDGVPVDRVIDRGADDRVGGGLRQRGGVGTVRGPVERDRRARTSGSPCRRHRRWRRRRPPGRTRGRPPWWCTRSAVAAGLEDRLDRDGLVAPPPCR